MENKKLFTFLNMLNYPEYEWYNVFYLNLLKWDILSFNNLEVLIDNNSLDYYFNQLGELNKEYIFEGLFKNLKKYFDEDNKEGFEKAKEKFNEISDSFFRFNFRNRPSKNLKDVYSDKELFNLWIKFNSGIGDDIMSFYENIILTDGISFSDLKKLIDNNLFRSFYNYYINLMKKEDEEKDGENVYYNLIDFANKIIYGKDYNKADLEVKRKIFNNYFNKFIKENI